MKRAFLVLGPESSGTRWLTGVLIAAGCAGDEGHVQRWDTTPPTDDPLIVWRRSFPHGPLLPNIPQKAAVLRAHDYHIQALVTTRDWFAMEQSQAVFQPSLAVVRANLQIAYPLIFAGLAVAHLPYLMISYEAIGQRPQMFMDRLLAALDLPSVPVAWTNGNTKWYEATTG